MKKPDAFRTYLTLEGGGALIFSMIFTASSIYQVTVAGLSPLQLVLVGTTLELAVSIFEVPTGVVADVYSRRLSVIIGYFLIGLGFILEGSIPLFATILLAQVLWGLGYTFTSGATQAWITDEIGEAAAGSAFLRASQIRQITSLAGIGLGTLMGSLRINLPIVLGGVCLILLALFLTRWMPETGFRPLPKEERSSWHQMVYTFRQGLAMVKRRPELSTILWIGLFYGLYSEGFDRLWTKHLLDNFTFPAAGSIQPVVWFGMLRAVGMLLSALAAGIANRRLNIIDHRGAAQVLLVITIGLIASLLVFARANTFALVVAMYWLIYIARTVIDPIYTAWVNQRLDPQVRATVLSMSSQVDAVGQIIGGPVMGVVGNLLSVRAAITLSGLSLSPVLALFARTIRRKPAAAVETAL